MNKNTTLALMIVLYCVLILWVLCSGIAPAQAGEYVGNFERVPAVEDRPPQVASWALTPTIIVCEYAPLSHIQINSAVQFWKQLGYRFYNTQYKHDPMRKCSNPNPRGYIVIHLVTMGIAMEAKSLAQTHFYINNSTNQIEWAIIYMRPQVRETVLEHELGHALGFLHYNKTNHLMNAKWTGGGWNTDGLENKQR